MPRKPKKFHFIYKTTNNVTGRYYVGMHSTDDINDGYLGSGLVLRRSVKRYGREAHTTEILEHCSSRDELKQREAEVVDEKLLGDPLCMNLKTGGEGGSDFQTAATRQKISLSKRGKKHYWSDAARQKLALYRTGRKHTDKTRAKVSRARKGSSVTEEVRSKISASMKSTSSRC